MQDLSGIFLWLLNRFVQLVSDDFDVEMRIFTPGENYSPSVDAIALAFSTDAHCKTDSHWTGKQIHTVLDTHCTGKPVDHFLHQQPF